MSDHFVDMYLQGACQDPAVQDRVRAIADALGKIQVELIKQERRLPFDFHADDELGVFIRTPQDLSSDICQTIQSFMDRYEVVARRVELFRSQFLLETELEQLAA